LIIQVSWIVSGTRALFLVYLLGILDQGAKVAWVKAFAAVRIWTIDCVEVFSPLNNPKMPIEVPLLFS